VGTMSIDTPVSAGSEAGDRAGHKLIMWFVLPLALLTMVNAIDRVNVSFAASAMMQDLRFGPQTFGMGISAFFVGYLLFQYPHAALLRRIGIKLWLGSALLLWGLAGLGMAFIDSVWQFIGLRFLLGVAESGFAPGVTYLVSQWVPPRYRARAMGIILAAVPLALVLGGPLCGWMLSLSNPLQIAPWRWMFLLQAIPNLLLMLFAIAYFVDRPKQARWLTDPDRDALDAEMEAPAQEPAIQAPVLPMLRDSRVIACAACWLLVMTGCYALLFWVPLLVRQLNPSGGELMIGMISALPQAGVVLGMLVNARHSDRTGERVAHFGLAALFAGIILLAASAVSTVTAVLALLTLTGVGIGAAQSVFWTLPAALRIGGGRVPIGVIAVIGMTGTMGGILGPMLLGTIREATGSFTLGIVTLALMLILAAPVALLQRRWVVPDRA
jgi:ACS family tartrate transporter-like MFS transporter